MRHQAGAAAAGEPRAARVGLPAGGVRGDGQTAAQVSAGSTDPARPPAAGRRVTSRAGARHPGARAPGSPPRQRAIIRNASRRSARRAYRSTPARPVSPSTASPAPRWGGRRRTGAAAVPRAPARPPDSRSENPSLDAGPPRPDSRPGQDRTVPRRCRRSGARHRGSSPGRRSPPGRATGPRRPGAGRASAAAFSQHLRSRAAARRGPAGRTCTRARGGTATRTAPHARPVGPHPVQRQPPGPPAHGSKK
jgi:hypothetical protein